MMISLREKAVIKNWFGDEYDSVMFLATIVPLTDQDETIAKAYQLIWDSLIKHFDDKQLSRFEAVLLWAGATIDCMGSETDYCLDFLEAREETDCQNNPSLEQ